MKSKLHNISSLLKYLINSEKFKVTYFLTIFLAIYGIFALGQDINSNQEAIIIIFQFPFFNIFLQFIALMNTINICSTFSKKFSFYYIRKKKKCEATKDLIILNILYNLLYFLVLFLIMFSLCLLLRGITTNSNLYYKYSITYNIYMFYYLIRYVIITILLSVLNTILYQRIHKKVLFVNIIFIITFIIYPTSFEKKSIINILPWNYFTFSNYLTFGNDLISSLIFITLLICIIIFCFKAVYRVKRK